LPAPYPGRLIYLAIKGIIGNIRLLTGAPGGIIGKCGKVLICKDLSDPNAAPASVTKYRGL